MKYVLMNKNTEVLIANYDEGIKVFDKIIEIRNIEYAPLIIKKSYEMKEDFRFNLNDWFIGRGIPSWRDELDMLLARLNISTPLELFDKAFTLSLSDQYWIKQVGSNIKYEDVNFFDHDFDSAEFVEASFSDNYDSITRKETLMSPNNTTNGMLKKSWIIEDGKRYLLKGGYKNDYLQPFNEVLASIICDKLDFDHVTYTLDTFKNKVVSKCLCFINKDTELIPASQIMYGITKHKTSKDYNEYIKILEQNGIKNAREKIENMYILDFLMMNEDRHLNNFGIIRDVNTLEWLDVAPIFDNGESLKMTIYNSDEISINGEGRLFYNIVTFDDIIKVVKDIKRIDISKLDGVVEEYDELLHKYQNITGITEDRINKLCILLNRQIKKLSHLITEKTI